MSLREIAGLASNTVKNHLRADESEPGHAKPGVSTQTNLPCREAGRLAVKRGDKIATTAARVACRFIQNDDAPSNVATQGIAQRPLESLDGIGRAGQKPGNAEAEVRFRSTDITPPQTPPG